MEREIYITKMDHERLSKLVERAIASSATQHNFYLELLTSELLRATIVDTKDIPKDVITMNSMVRLKCLDQDKEMTFSLVYPDIADRFKDTLSILSPIGIAIIGYHVGDIIEWDIPEGKVNISILEIMYQPEIFGHYEL